jgi:hypothetical protein
LLHRGRGRGRVPENKEENRLDHGRRRRDGGGWRRHLGGVELPLLALGGWVERGSFIRDGPRHDGPHTDRPDARAPWSFKVSVSAAVEIPVGGREGGAGEARAHGRMCTAGSVRGGRAERRLRNS